MRTKPYLPTTPTLHSEVYGIVLNFANTVSEYAPIPSNEIPEIALTFSSEASQAISTVSNDLIAFLSLPVKESSTPEKSKISICPNAPKKRSHAESVERERQEAAESRNVRRRLF